MRSVILVAVGEDHPDVDLVGVLQTEVTQACNHPGQYQP